MSDLSARLDGLVSDERCRLDCDHELVLTALTNAVARRMTEQGISQAELARRMGVSRARVSQLLQHRSSPTLRTIVQLACALGCSLEIGLSEKDG